MFGTKSKDGQSLKDPGALTDYYMDTFLCTEYQLKHAVCMEEYASAWRFSFGRRKKYIECANFFDEYKACLIGINQNTVFERKFLTLEEAAKRRADAP